MYKYYIHIHTVSQSLIHSLTHSLTNAYAVGGKEDPRSSGQRAEYEAGHGEQ